MQQSKLNNETTAVLLKFRMPYFFLRPHQDETLGVSMELAHRIHRQIFHIVTACYFSYPLNGSQRPRHAPDAHLEKL